MQFNDQADIYDERTGLGQKTAQNIALSLEQMIQPFLTGKFLEIGAGTGEIGFFLQDFVTPYVGIDLSSGMLDVYRKRFIEQTMPDLIETDANTVWPLEDHSVSVFFSSRAMHQLNHEHVLNELKRLAAPEGAVLILGNVKRRNNSAKAMMRREMHQILSEYGLKEKSGQSNRKVLFTYLETLGGERLDTVVSSRWQVSHAPMDSIRSWQSVEGIAGQAVDEALKEKILARLMLKVQGKLIDLNQALETEEIYELNGIKLL